MYIEGFPVNSICCLGFALKHTWPENKEVNTYRHNTFKRHVCRGEEKEKANYKGGNCSSQNGHTGLFYYCISADVQKSWLKKIIIKKKKPERARETKKENRHLQPSPGTPKSSQMKPFFEHEEYSYRASHGPGT